MFLFQDVILTNPEYRKENLNIVTSIIIINHNKIYKSIRYVKGLAKKITSVVNKNNIHITFISNYKNKTIFKHNLNTTIDKKITVMLIKIYIKIIPVAI